MAEDGAADAAAPLGWGEASRKRDYYRVFAAYVVSVFATGVATVALALLAYELAGDEAGLVLGTALSLKMAAYVSAPLAAALTDRAPFRPLMLSIIAVQASCLGLMGWVWATWQIHALVFVFSLASATFFLVYQTVVPYLLTRPEDYAQSLVRSRLVNELERSVAPLLAAVLLLVLAGDQVFYAAMTIFALGGWLVATATLPADRGTRAGGPFAKVLRGPVMLLGRRDLRAAVAVDAATAFATAMVIVNTVILVQDVYGLADRAVGFAFAAFGGGSVVGAYALLRFLQGRGERAAMIVGAALAAGGLMVGAAVGAYISLLVLWGGIGFGAGLSLTAATLLIRRVAPAEDLQTLFAARLALSNLLLLAAYSAAGWLAAEAGLTAAFILLGLLAAAAAGVVAANLRPRQSRRA